MSRIVKAATRTNPSGEKSAAPICFIVDEDARVRHFLSLIAHGAGVDAVDFESGTVFCEQLAPKAQGLVFLDAGEHVLEAIVTIEALGKARFAGAVQLMGSQTRDLETLRIIGERNWLRMLPPIRKPFDAGLIKTILKDEKLGEETAEAGRVRLDQALQKGWVETWYQPKIELRHKRLGGAEAFARVRHPKHGVVAPGGFLEGADNPTLIALAERTLVDALELGAELSTLGVNVRIAVNMSMAALSQVPIAQIVKRYRPKPQDWAGLIIDVTEEQICRHAEQATDIAGQMAEWNIRLAIDDFGRGVSSLMKLSSVPLAEMKLDRSFVAGCSSNRLNASICRSVIDLAHSFGSTAVGIGVESAEDLNALAAMGCDLGQGYLLGQPMAAARFSALLKQRVGARG